MLHYLDGLAIFIDSIHVTVTVLLHLVLLHLLLVDQELLLLFRCELLQEFLLLLRVQTFKRLNKLHSLVLELCLLLHCRALLDTRVHDVLAFTLLLFRRHFVNNLLVLLGLLLGQ